MLKILLHLFLLLESRSFSYFYLSNYCLHLYSMVCTQIRLKQAIWVQSLSDLSFYITCQRFFYKRVIPFTPKDYSETIVLIAREPREKTIYITYFIGHKSISQIIKHTREATVLWFKCNQKRKKKRGRALKRSFNALNAVVLISVKITRAPSSSVKTAALSLIKTSLITVLNGGRSTATSGKNGRVSVHQ